MILNASVSYGCNKERKPVYIERATQKTVTQGRLHRVHTAQPCTVCHKGYYLHQQVLQVQEQT